MSQLLSNLPYGTRNDAVFLAEMNALCRHHLEGCPEYARMWPAWRPAQSVVDLPYLHVRLFKHLELKTVKAGIRHERALLSSATTGNQSSRILLDEQSSKLQSASSLAILKEELGDHPRPLLILDEARALCQPGKVMARVAAAMSLRPLASDIHFLLDDAQEPASMKWDKLATLLDNHRELIVYGITWLLWSAWGAAAWPQRLRAALAGKRIHFVHSGGWKKLEHEKVARAQFDSTLLRGLDITSRVVDFYGLVEQVGMVYPLCQYGFRHTPVWGDVIVRDPHTLEPLVGRVGQLQLLNSLAHGAPYHSVLTEDLGYIEPGECPCRRSGKRFELVGRMPNVEARGCANV
ncbi:hypothetical protein HUU40_17095 [candidate division KSB1 bacterium]|nr:hypothetical protein [candidate division KSB1 bacterium]